jgi:hypothetical protein
MSWKEQNGNIEKCEVRYSLNIVFEYEYGKQNTFIIIVIQV